MTAANTTTTYICGAMDPEMKEIIRVLGAQDAHVVRATSAGAPVHPGTMYRADGWASSAAQSLGERVVLVECRFVPSFDWGGRAVTVVDHHGAGDPGYGCPPDGYFWASSLGQILGILGLPATLEQRLIAAGDHCPGAAYRGQCPGVDPGEFREWRVKSRAEFQRRAVDAVEADIEAAIRIIESTPLTFSDLPFWWRDFGDRDIPELSEAGALLGRPIMARPRPGPDGRARVIVQQWCDRALIWWRDEGAVSLGYVDPYAVLGQGIGGAYLP